MGEKDNAQEHMKIIIHRGSKEIGGSCVEVDRLKYEGDQFYFKSREEMDALFPDDSAALDRAAEIAARCKATIEMGSLHFPQFPLLDRRDLMECFSGLAYDGLRKIYGISDSRNPASAFEQNLIRRLDAELRIIEKTGFINYFLVVSDYVRFARSKGIPVSPGNGSSGGSLVAYALGITEIDPIRFNLVFERFLNPDRVAPPDIDIEICPERRSEVIEYITNKYGADRVAQIGAVIRFNARTAIRDVARALEIPREKASRLVKLVSSDPGSRLANLREANMKFGKACGLLKLDIRGSKARSKLDKMVELVQRSGVIFVLRDLPLDDRKTYEMISRADTEEVFQLESAGIRRLIQKVGVNKIEDLIAMIALYRPGPMELLPGYMQRKTGMEDVVYDHPLLEPILRETYGVFVYQEQVILAANILAGYSLGQADLLRRAMGKKKALVLARERVRFVEGCAMANQIQDQLAGSIFDHIAASAGYTFCKAHATGYGLIAYQMAYLKANYPAVCVTT